MLVPYGSEFVLPTPTKKGYYFVGWGGNLLFPMKATWDDPLVAVHLKACWSKFKPGTVYVLGEYEQTALYDKDVFCTVFILERESAKIKSSSKVRRLMAASKAFSLSGRWIFFNYDQLTDRYGYSISDDEGKTFIRKYGATFLKLHTK